jgi:hypothetical protein
MKSSTPSQPKPPDSIKILFMGLPGSRKTTFALQFPLPHVYNCDNNLDGPERICREGLPKEIPPLPPICPNLDYTFDDIRRDDKGKMIDISECFDRLVDKLILAAKDPAYQQRRVHIIDSLSHVNEFIIRKVLKMRSKSSMEINLWTDFASGAYTLIVAKMEQVGKPIICTCHEERLYESDSSNIMKKNVTEINPLFSGRVGDNIGAYFTDVWQLEKRVGPKTADNPRGIQLWLLTDRSARCQHLKNSVGMPAEINVTTGYKAIEPYLKGRV